MLTDLVLADRMQLQGMEATEILLNARSAERHAVAAAGKCQIQKCSVCLFRFLPVIKLLSIVTLTLWQALTGSQVLSLILQKRLQAHQTRPAKCWGPSLLSSQVAWSFV